MKDANKTKKQLMDELAELRRKVSELEGKRPREMAPGEEARVMNDALESSITAIAFADPEGRLTYVNRSFLNLWGYGDAKEVLGRPAVGFWQSEVKAREVIDRLFADGSWVGELRAVRKDGTLFDVELSASLVRDEAGAPLCMMSSFVDATARKNAERELLENKKLFQRVFDDAAIGMCLVSIDGTFLKVNSTLCSMLGYAAAELTGKTFQDITHEDDQGRSMEVLKDLLSGRLDKARFEKRYIHKDGRTVWAAIFTTPLRDDEGRPLYFITQMEDITERKRAEENLLSERQRFFTLLNSLPVLVYLQAPDHTIRFANRYFIERYGEPCTKPCYEVIWGRTEPCEECPTFRVFETKEPVVWISEHTPEGDIFQIHDYPFTDTDGSPLVLEVSFDITELKRAEGALRESEEKFRGIAERSFDAILITDSRGYYTYISPGDEKNTGVRAKEGIGRHFADFLPEPTIPAAKKAFERVMKGESIEGLELLAQKRDGTPFYIECNITPIHKGEEVVGAQIIYRNISSRKEAESALRESEEKYRRLFESESDAVMVFDAETLEFEDANQATLDLFGYSRDEFLALTPLDISAEREKTLAAIKEVRDGAPGSGSVPLRYFKRKDGGVFPGEISTGIFSTMGRDKVIGAVRDVTERKRAEEALHESESRNRVLVETIPHGVQENDASGVVTFSNPAHARILGYDEGEPVGMHIWDFIDTEEEKDRLRRYLKRLVTEQPPPSPYFTRNRTKDGRLVDVQVDWNYKRGDSSEVVGFVSVITDITERKRAEEERVRLQAQLIQSQKMEAIGILAGGIAHDFNNIMTVIMNLTSLALARADGDDGIRKYLEPLRDTSERATNLVQQLLIFSQNKPLEVVSLNLNDTIDDILTLLTSLVSEDITIRSDLEYDLRDIEADRGRMEQVITNLIINSSDAMPRGGVITIGTENVDVTEEQSSTLPGSAPGRYVLLTVDDTGTGMDGETVSHIFEPFFTTKSPRGTGLGLSVVYGIVKELKGWIDVKSEPGRGSSFKVYIPASEEAGWAGEKAADRRSAADGGGRRILLVEDDKWVRKSTAMALSENGYVVFEAANAEGAIGRFYREKGRFDLVLSDVVMPGKSGLQMLDSIRDINPRIPVLLFSGHLDDRAQLDEIIRKGFAFIQKPYEIPELLKAIEETIAQGS